MNIKYSVVSVFILTSFAVLWRPTPIQLKTRRSSDLSNFPFSPSLKSVNTGRSHSFEFAYIQFLQWYTVGFGGFAASIVTRSPLNIWILKRIKEFTNFRGWEHFWKNKAWLIGSNWIREANPLSRCQIVLTKRLLSLKNV